MLDALAPGASALLTLRVRLAVMAVLVAVVLTCAAARIRGRLRSAAELALLAAVFLTVPPLVAFAGSFDGWHSLRQVVRLLVADPANTASLAGGQLAQPILRFARQAALPTAAALLVLAALVVVTRGSQGWLAADLTLLAALTVPHMLTVACLDRHAAAAGLIGR